jgi:alkylation response protein AidB-like acyl-CoA dehydrogenase
VNFGFSDEQELLRRQARDFLDRECGSARVRQLMEAEAAHDPRMYARIAELGWTAIPFAERHGGLGLGLVDLAVVLEEMGRHVAPSPLQSSVCLAGMTVAASGDEEQAARLLPAICDGSACATVALVEESGRWDAGGVQLAARRSGDAWLLRGEKLFVPDAQVAGWMIVATRTADDPADGLTLLLVDTDAPGVTVRPLASMDATRRMAVVGFDDVEVAGGAVLGEPGRGWATLRRGLDRAMVGIAAELAGTAQRVLEMSVDYAKVRQQFGRPIGTYQAVSHRCADMLVMVESARSLAYHAAWALDNDVPEAPLAAAMAKAYAGDAARTVASLGLQVHGGIGFTWEHDIHLFLKRAKWGEATLGDASHHRERVAQLLEL